MALKRVMLLLALIAVGHAKYVDDYEKHHNEALRTVEAVTDSIYATETCPLGFEYGHNGKCLKTLVTGTTDFCPKGTTLEHGFCVKHNVYNTQCTCLEGFKLAGHECITTVEEASALSCKKGFTLQGTSCTKTVDVPLSEFCPIGYTRKYNDCVKKVTLKPDVLCIEGYELVNESGKWICRKTDLAEIKESCVAGYKLVGDTCLKISSVNPKPVCEHGFVLIAGQCIREFYEPAGLVCKDGDLVGKYCKEVWTKEADKTCPNGMELNAAGDLCTVLKTALPLIKCQFGYTLIPGTETCEKTTSHLADTVCPSGLKRVGNKCVGKETSPVSEHCPDGFDGPVEGKCIKQDTKEVKRLCPYGFTMSAGSCSRTRVTVVKKLCSAGRLSGDVCEVLEKHVLQRVCDKGTSIGEDGCINVLTDTPNPVCPKGTVLTKEGVCERVVRRKCEKVCPFGSTKEGAHCTSIEQSNPKQGCPHGYEHRHEDGNCARMETAEAQKECPQGYTLNKKTDLCTKLQGHEGKIEHESWWGNWGSNRRLMRTGA